MTCSTFSDPIADEQPIEVDSAQDDQSIEMKEEIKEEEINEDIEMPKEEMIEVLVHSESEKDTEIVPSPEPIEDNIVVKDSPVEDTDSCPIPTPEEPDIASIEPKYSPEIPNEKELTKTEDYSDLVNETVQSDNAEINTSFDILPNTLILQQESIVLEKPACSENVCAEESAEKLEASVEESDLVIAQISRTNFDGVRSIADEEDANEDRFIDAENYVLESGQISVSEAQDTNKETAETEIQDDLFAPTAVTRGKIACY